MLRRLAVAEHEHVRTLRARVEQAATPPGPRVDVERLRTQLTVELSRGFDALVAELVTRIGDAPDITLRAHPDDLASLSALAVQVARIGDAAMTRGGCVIESAHGRLDATVEARVALLLAAVEVAS